MFITVVSILHALNSDLSGTNLLNALTPVNDSH